MDESNKKFNRRLTEHFFRNEYGKMVSVITRYIGTENVETAEDIVQETLLKAVDLWQHNGLPKILVNSKIIDVKADSYALLGLMYLNASRYEARINYANAIIEMGKQDRRNWNQKLINRGVHYLNLASKENSVSKYLILAAISANHCIAKKFEDTNWMEILALYDKLILLEDSPIARLNRSVVLSKVKGNRKAILELQHLESLSDIGDHYLFHSTIAEFYILESETLLAISHLKNAISLAQNKKDIEFLNNKLENIVPIL